MAALGTATSRCRCEGAASPGCRIGARGGAGIAGAGSTRSSGAATTASTASASSLAYDVRNLKFTFAVLIGSGVWSTAEGAVGLTLVVFGWGFESALSAPRCVRIRANVCTMAEAAAVVTNFRVSAEKRASNYARPAVYIIGNLHSLEQDGDGCGVLDAFHLQGTRVALCDDQFSELGIGEVNVNASDDAFARVIGWSRIYSNSVQSVSQT